MQQKRKRTDPWRQLDDWFGDHPQLMLVFGATALLVLVLLVGLVVNYVWPWAVHALNGCYQPC